MNGGVLMAANERFFWPLGLALAWTYDPTDGSATGLHVRQWEYADGHRETIADLFDDGVGAARRAAFFEWCIRRARLLPSDERFKALDLIGISHLPSEMVVR